MDKFEWQLFYIQLQINAAETYERLRQKPGVTTCEACNQPQLGDKCERCGEKACLGNGGLCCKCCEIAASKIEWDKIPFIEDEED